jgi:hypothetical protein
MTVLKCGGGDALMKRSGDGARIVDARAYKRATAATSEARTAAATMSATPVAGTAATVLRMVLCVSGVKRSTVGLRV